MRLPKTTWACTFVMWISATLGCSNNDLVFAPVSGQVLLDDAPLVGAEVVFSPMGDQKKPNPGPFSTAITDEKGNFELKSRQGFDGAVVGLHRVGIRIATAENPELIGQQKVDQLMAEAKGSLHELTLEDIEYARQSAHQEVNRLSAIYNEQSELQFEVKQQDNNIATFELNSNAG